MPGRWSRALHRPELLKGVHVAGDPMERKILAGMMAPRDGGGEQAAPSDRDRQQAALLARAVRTARDGTRRNMGTDVRIWNSTNLRSIREARQGGEFRKLHAITLSDLVPTDAELAFGDPPDSVREAHAAFCYAMWSNYGSRYIDRNQAEKPEEFIDRPRRHTIALTRLIISILSKLYHKPPTRTLDASTPEHVKSALQAIWSPAFNLALQDVDRLTRLLGTVAVRPFYDPESPGRIRLWAFLSHQLRVVPDPERPWRPAAVIERVQPFRRGGLVNIWTDEWFAQLGNGNEVKCTRHKLGRIPHTIFRDSRSFTSFFVEGRGRMLCDPHALINNKLTDLAEIEQMQGYSIAEVYNPEGEPVFGPRQAIVFRPGPDDRRQYGVKFVSPGAPIVELRRAIDQDISQVLRDNGVPDAALGAAIQQRQLSGAAIRAAMQPITDDLEDRGRMFSVFELDLADACLCTLAAYTPPVQATDEQGAPVMDEQGAQATAPGFVYDPETQRPKFTMQWAKLDMPMDTGEKVKREEFDVAQGVQTPADLMFERFPEKFKDRDAALDGWRSNLEEMKALGMPATGGDGQDPTDARFGDQAAAASTTPHLDALMSLSGDALPLPLADERTTRRPTSTAMPHVPGDRPGATRPPV